MKRSPMRPQSSDKARERAERRALVEALTAADLWHCQVGVTLRRAYYDGHDLPIGELDCFDTPSGIHERRKRSAGGSLTLLANLMPACTFHNQWVEANPGKAHDLALVVRPGDHEWNMLGADRGGF